MKKRMQRALNESELAARRRTLLIEGRKKFLGNTIFSKIISKFNRKFLRLPVRGYLVVSPRINWHISGPSRIASGPMNYVICAEKTGPRRAVPPEVVELAVGMPAHKKKSHYWDPVVQIRVEFETNGRLLCLKIEDLQGIDGVQKELRVFGEKTGRPWNVFLAQSIIDAAYHCGFDRVMLHNIEATESYAAPFFRPAIGQTYGERDREIGRRRAAMKQLYTRTAKECGFSKKEGEYFVREFP